MGKPKSSPLSSRKAETTTNRTTTTTKRFARKMNAPKKQQQQQRESDPSNGVVVVDDDDDEKKKKKKKDETNKTSPATRKTTKETPPKNKNTIGDQEENDPYAFDNAKELFGKVDEEVLTVEDDEEDVEMEAEKYFANKRGESLALFGKKLLMKRDARPVAVAGAVASSEEGTKRRRVSFATEGDEEADVVQKSPAKNDEKSGEADVVQKTLMSPAKSDEKNGEALFDEALATEIKLTPEKPIQFKRQKTPSPVKQIVIPEASTRNNLIQSSDPQTHLQVLERHGNTSHQEQQQTLASTLWLLKKIASNTQYRRRLSRERPHFATSMFTAALKIAGKSATDAKLRLAAIALAYLFSLEIKTFSRVLDSMDIALGVAACVDEVNFIENVNDEDDDDEECIVVAGVDNEVEQTVETSLSALKFLPNEKSACAKNIALLLAFRALQWGSEEEEEEEKEENGQEGQQSKDKQRPIFGGDATSRALRARFSRSGFITSVAKLANESCKDLVQSIHSRKTKKNKLNQEEEEEMKRKARKSCARLFRCARVIEAATYASTETVTILASSNLPVWESSPSSKSDNDDNGDADGADDDAFGEPTPSSNANTLSSCVLKLAEVSLLSEEEEEKEEEEEEEEEPKEDKGNIAATSIPTTTTTTTTVSTPPRPISGRKGGEEDNNNNSSFLQIGSPATVGASPVFGQVAKSPGAALDSWLAKSPKDGDVDMSPKAKAGENSDDNNYNNNNNSKKNNWSLARCLIETLPTLTLLTSRSMRPRAKSLHGIQTSEYLNPNIDVRLSLATLKACVFALTNSTNENTVGARAASSRDGLHGIVAALAYFSTMRGCALYGEFAGFVPKKDNMEGTVPDAYKEAATELLNASMCLLVNITEANPRAKKELLQLQLNCAPFGIGKAEDFEKKKTKTKNDGKKSSNEKMISPLVPFPTVLARIFTHAGGAKMHRAQDEEEGEEGQSQGDDDDDDDEVTADMLDDDDDAATANADLDPSYGEDLITQAYSSLLLAFLVENNRQALRRTTDQALPRGRGRQNTNGKTIRTTKNGVQAMVDTLERFHAFHDTLDAMSASSSESLKRVVEWLKSTLT